MQPVRTVSAPLDSDPRYRCCCNCMHVKIGAIIIGVLEILGSLHSVGYVFGSKSQEKSQASIFGGVIGAIICVVVVTLMFVAIWKKKPALVIPHMVFQIIAIIGLIIAAVLTIIILIAATAVVAAQRNEQRQYQDEEDRRHGDGVVVGTLVTITIITVALFILYALLEVWFFIVILKLYRYLREVASSVTYPNVQYSSPNNPPAPPPPSYEEKGMYPKAV